LFLFFMFLMTLKSIFNEWKYEVFWELFTEMKKRKILI
jgi:hypothetical protein